MKSTRKKPAGMKGITRRKDGYYLARFVSKSGKREQHYTKDLTEAKNWLAKAKALDKANHTAEYALAPADYTVDRWFPIWLNTMKSDLAPNTKRNYQERYTQNIQPLIGNKFLRDVTPLDCQIILNTMETATRGKAAKNKPPQPKYKGSTIHQTYICLGSFLRSAVRNDLIPRHPMDGMVFSKLVRAAKEVHFLTREEQSRFLEAAKHSHNYAQYLLLLDTGLRTSEMIGLTWDSIDWEKHTLTVDKCLEYRFSTHAWRAGPLKSKSSYRTIPLTDRSYAVLQELYANRQKRTEAPLLDTRLPYVNKKTGETKEFCMRELIFINYRTGEPVKNNSYDTHLLKLCRQAGIEPFSMHCLRHTFATRAIESGMQPKVLQVLLGHSSLAMTMDRYVHVEDSTLEEAIRRFEAGENE